MRCERTENSGAGVEGRSQNVHFCAVGFEKAIKHFEDIFFWAGRMVRMTGMIKLRHQQPSLWHRGLAEDIEGWGCGNRGCGWWTSCWKTSNLWTRCTKPKGNAIRKAAGVAECKHPRKYWTNSCFAK